MTNSEHMQIQVIWPLRNAIEMSWAIFIIPIAIQVLKLFTVTSPVEIIINLLHAVISFLFILFFFSGFIGAVREKDNFSWEIKNGTLMVNHKGKKHQYNVSDLTNVGLHRSIFDKIFGLGSVSAKILSDKETPKVIATIDGTRGIGSGLTPYVSRLEFAGIVGDIIHIPGLKIKDAETVLESLKPHS